MKVKKTLIGIGICLAFIELILFIGLLTIANSSIFVAWASTIVGLIAGLSTLVTAALGSN